MPLRVLLVEDEPSLRYLERAALEDEGCEVREAGDGVEALDVLGGWEPHVIVLDSTMPVMGASEFREEQQRRGLAAGAALVLVSGIPDSEHLAQALLAAAVLDKPFDLDEFAALVLRLGPSPDDPPARGSAGPSSNNEGEDL